MAAVATANRLWDDATGGRKSALYQLSDVGSGDTIDLASVGGITFKKIVAAVFFGQAQGTGVVGTVSSNTVVTMTSSGMTKDSVLLLVEGVT